MIYGNKTCFVENWYADRYGTKNQTTVNSVSTANYGVIDLKSTGIDAYIHMPTLGSFAPATYKYVHILYRVVSGAGGTPAIYYYNAEGGANETRRVNGGAYTADGAWHVMVIDMSVHAKWLDSNITGWRFDWTNANGANVQFGYIALSSSATPPEDYEMSFLFPYVPSKTVITYTSGSGNWTCPAGVTEVYVECWGGGGCGGYIYSPDIYSYFYASGGGGAGAYAAGWVSVTPGNSYAYVVGAGGNGNYLVYTPGGNSTFNSTSIVAAGGARGPYVLSSYNSNVYGNGGSGGTVAASTGTVRYAGGNGGKARYEYIGGYHWVRSGAGGGAAGSTGAGGNASYETAGTGTSEGGGNGAAGVSTRNKNPGPYECEGTNGYGYGGAGSGVSIAIMSRTGYWNGGNGANGAVRITYEV